MVGAHSYCNIMEGDHQAVIAPMKTDQVYNYQYPRIVCYTPQRNYQPAAHVAIVFLIIGFNISIWQHKVTLFIVFFMKANN